MNTPELFMLRCLELAKLGTGYVAPNPVVGAILVHNEKIIGEGYHKKLGEAHAEVNCISSVNANKKNFISESVMYVSLEPCAHFGKTPPCTDLIIKSKILKVVIGCRDPFTKVDGKGIEKLLKAGVEIKLGVLEKECKEINKRFLTFHTKHRPYIILKWAQTANGKISGDNTDRLHITNEFTNRLVHKWRSEESSILIGTNTALKDDPSLTTRFWQGNSPTRLVIDMDLRLPQALKIFDQKARTIIFNKLKHEEGQNFFYYRISEDADTVHQIINALYQTGIQSVLVEGGAKLLQSFIDDELWDEARIIKNENLIIDKGLAAPELNKAIKINEQKIFSDRIETFLAVK
jgi:diaminohydroxyphosphoribosylaminopyrimidine deaminase/5-amino-6-(5-phosphoribosylamino)uracil reductase